MACSLIFRIFNHITSLEAMPQYYLTVSEKLYLTPYLKNFSKKMQIPQKQSNKDPEIKRREIGWISLDAMLISQLFAAKSSMPGKVQKSRTQPRHHLGGPTKNLSSERKGAPGKTSICMFAQLSYRVYSRFQKTNIEQLGRFPRYLLKYNGCQKITTLSFAEQRPV